VTERPLRVLIADDHPVVREGLAAMLEASGDFMVVAQAENAAQALALFVEHRPDVALVDLRMPGGGGIAAIEAIRRKLPEARVLVLTSYDGDEDIYRALVAGARGYLLKSAPLAELRAALRAAAAGKRVLPPEVAGRLAARLPQSELTPRELAVLREIVRGRSNKEIGKELGVAESTVKTFVLGVLGKLGVDDRTGAAVAAIRRGLVHLEDLD
jgi:two-component system NarL family response regulator